MNNANVEWLKLLSALTHAPKVKAQQSAGAGGSGSREIISHNTVVDMRYPVVTVSDRKIGYRFMAAEAAWILSGDDRVETIAPYSRDIANFSDDGVRFFGAYGPKILEQLDYVVDCLWADRDTRQAVLTIWRENPPATKDKPCTLEVQWLIRQGKLYCVDTMRSSDAWLGWPYDVFNFSMLSALIALKLCQLGVEVSLGSLHLTAGSQHLYDRNYDDVVGILERLNITFYPYGETYPAFNPLKYFRHSDDLVKTLWSYAKKRGALKMMQDLGS